MNGNRFLLLTAVAAPLAAQTISPGQPTWWAKYQYLSQHASAKTGKPGAARTASNVDVSNECGPQSETSISLDPASSNVLAGGSNEIYRLPMRGYFSADGGSTWGGVDLPLPPALVPSGTRFGSDPGLAFDTLRNAFYSYIVVFFGKGSGVTGTELAVARSGDGGQTYPNVTYFNFQSGGSHFNDKPMIAADTNAGSPFRDNVYVAWDTGTSVLVGRSTDHGATFSVTGINNPRAATVIGADPFVGPNGEVYVAWNDSRNNVIAFNRSFDGGATWGTPGVIAAKTLPFDIAIPAESYRGALVYPSCDTDRSSGPHRGRLYCTWMDETSGGDTDIFVAFSDDRGTSWSTPAPATDRLRIAVDRFNQWFSIDPVSGIANLSFYDTRNDTTGFRYMTDIYLTQSSDGVAWLSPNLRITTASSNEHDCNGVFPCGSIDYGNQYGDYAGLVSFGGISHPLWTDSREQLAACDSGTKMEEVFTATVKTR